MANQKKYTIFLIFFIYIFLYAPDIKGIPFPTPLFLLPFTYYYLLSNRTALPRFYKLFRIEILLLFALLIYVFILDFSYGRNVYFTHVCYYIFEVLPTCFFIVAVFFKHSNRDSFYKLLIIVGTIAATISILSLLIRPLNDLLTFILKGNPITDPYTGRDYGFASGFLYTYPIGQGFIGVLCLKMSSKSKKYIVPFLLILISIVINARIGLIPIFIYFIYVLLTFNLKSIIFLVLLTGVIVVVINSGLLSAHQELVDWNLSMFYDISNYFLGTDLGKYGGSYSWFNFVIDNFLVFPTNTIDWIFGENREIFLAIRNHSDVGYINDLIYGGLILVFLITLFFIRVSGRLFRINEKNCKLIAFLILGIYLLANLKGEFFRPSSGNRVLILAFSYFIYNSTYFNKFNSDAVKNTNRLTN